MIQPSLYVFSKTEEMKNSISRYIKYIGINCEKLKHEFDPQTHAKTYSFLEEITTILNEKPPDTLINTAVVLDVSDTLETDLDTWNPLSNKPSPATNIAASLVLAYPEVYWIFIGMYYNKPQDTLHDKPHDPPWLAEHFVNPSDTPSGMQKCIDLLKRHQNGYKPIFDPSGLRTWIKSGILNKENVNNVNRKSNCAVVIEEELPFTYLNGYVAYRFNYCCYMITSKGEMGLVLNKKNNEITVSLEDLDIKLSGMSEEEVVEARKLYERAEEYKGLGSPTFCEEEFKDTSAIAALCEVISEDKYNISLQASPNTIGWLNELLGNPNFYNILTTQSYNPNFSRSVKILEKITRNYRDIIGPLDKGQMIVIKKFNHLLLEEKYPKQTPKNRIKRLIVTGVASKEERMHYENAFEIIDKPYDGIYCLKEYIVGSKASLVKKLLSYISREVVAMVNIVKKFASMCKRYITANHNKTLTQSSVKQSNDSFRKSHSAPNRILTIADFLIGRARNVLDDAKSCEEFVLGAVLALEAKELLCGQSMTTALEAVSLQHQLEVKAECSFLGVAHEIKVEPRFEEIESEVNRIIGIPEKSKSTIDNIIAIFKKCETRLYAKSYNTQLEIVNNIRGIFNDYEQFDEEERCIIKTRKFRQRLHWHQPWGKWQKWIYSITIELYLNSLMKTKGYIPWYIGLASLCWIVFFAVVLTYCCPTQFSVNSFYFHESEFEQSSDIRKLCRETTKVGLGKHIHARIDSVNRLNELIQVPNLYNSVLRKYPNITFSGNVNTLLNETQEYRNQRYSSLEADAQDTIKKLNRRLLEEKYEKITPKHDTSKIEGFSVSVLWKSARLYLLTFLELSHQDELNGRWWLFFISIFEILVAHAHLGIFISYLFQKLARR